MSKKSKIEFIMSDSEAFLRDEVLRISQEWGFNKSSIKTIEEWNPALVRGATSLFGDVSMIHLDLNDKNKLKKFADLISDKKTKDMFSENWSGPGLIITSTHAVGTKKIETLVTSSGGKVQKKGKPAEMKKLLFKRVQLSKDAKDFLDAYSGEDYQILIGVINEIEKLDEDTQKNMKIEDLVVRLPGKPGALPPWEFINPMLEGNASKAIDLYKRSVEGSHVLVTMKLARTKLQLLYRIKILQISGVFKSEEQAKILNERNGPNIWNLSKVAQKIDVSTTEYLAKVALKAEADLKGHSNADPDILFKNFIATTCLAIRYNRTMPFSIR